MLRIYGSAKSRGIRVLWMAGELGLEYEHKDYLPRSPETRTPEFLALNPNARVPVIDDDGFILSESMAINMYLAKKHGSPLYPSDPQNEARAMQWSLWETDRLDRQIVNYQRHTKDLPAGRARPVRRRRGMEGSRPGARRAGDRAHEERVACRSGILGRRSERGGGAFPRALDGPREVAARRQVAAPLLGASGREARCRAPCAGAS